LFALKNAIDDNSLINEIYHYKARYSKIKDEVIFLKIDDNKEHVFNQITYALLTLIDKIEFNIIGGNQFVHPLKNSEKNEIFIPPTTPIEVYLKKLFYAQEFGKALMFNRLSKTEEEEYRQWLKNLSGFAVNNKYTKGSWFLKSFLNDAYLLMLNSNHSLTIKWIHSFKELYQGTWEIKHGFLCLNFTEVIPKYDYDFIILDDRRKKYYYGIEITNNYPIIKGLIPQQPPISFYEVYFFGRD